MAKLNTTVDNLQLKSNKVSGNLPSASWTDEQYPSAKTLYTAYNTLHPVGSIICMATNKNPGDLLGFGTWELVDKELTNNFYTLTTGKGWTDVNGTATSDSGFHISGHSLTLRLILKLNNATSDSTYIVGTIDPSYLGLTQLPLTKTGIPFTVDGGEVVGNATISTAGTVQINDGWTVSSGAISHSINLTYSVPIHASYTVPYQTMLDEKCNKFYFKRTA